MRPSSCKAKGRRHQQFICKALQELGAPYGLEPEDIKSTSMGVSGVDVQLSPAAKRLFGNLCIEGKNVEKLNVVGVFQEHCAKYTDPSAINLLIHSRNRTEPMVTMRFADFAALLKAALKAPKEDAKT
jgi:hypothetical protein